MLSYSSHSISGGPVSVGGADGNTAVTYQNPNITLNVENGDFGILSNAVAVALLQEAFDLWNTVDTSAVNLGIDQAVLNFDINKDNADTYIPKTDNSALNTDNINPVVFDSNGEIIDAFFGGCNPGEICQSDLVLGFALSVITTNSSFFNEGFLVLNGKKADRTNTQIKLLFAHEIAHYFGLDHSQVDINNQESFSELPFFCATSNADTYPLMYPVACRDIISLHPDDSSAVSALYPSSTINDNFGILEGHFVDESGNAILGANIWVENTTSGDTFSIVSDYLKQGTGFYKLYLPAGAYTLHANSINTEFTGGSGVGPYSNDSSDASFTAPHPISLVTYHGSSEINDGVLNITASQTLSIDFSIIGALVTPPPASNSDDDDSFADLFGATSHLTLILLPCLLIAARRFA